MGLPNGVHHLAICTKDIKGQIEFFTQVVGMELVALYWMHGVPETIHGFLRLNDRCSIAFVQGPQMADIEPVLGVSHAGSAAGPVAPGAMQHVALNVDSEAELLALRDRLRSNGYWVMGPIDHGMCKSMYLSAPEGIVLEFAASTPPTWRATAGPRRSQIAAGRCPTPTRTRVPGCTSRPGWPRSSP